MWKWMWASSVRRRFNGVMMSVDVEHIGCDYEITQMCPTWMIIRFQLSCSRFVSEIRIIAKYSHVKFSMLLSSCRLKTFEECTLYLQVRWSGKFYQRKCCDRVTKIVHTSPSLREREGELSCYQRTLETSDHLWCHGISTTRLYSQNEIANYFNQNLVAFRCT